MTRRSFIAAVTGALATLILPIKRSKCQQASAGRNGQVLIMDGTGHLAWADHPAKTYGETGDILLLTGSTDSGQGGFVDHSRPWTGG